MPDLARVLDRAGDVRVTPVDVDQLVHRARRWRRARRAAVVVTAVWLSVTFAAGVLAVIQRDTRPVDVLSGDREAGPSTLPSRWEERAWPADASGIERIVTTAGQTFAVGWHVLPDGGPEGSSSPAIWAATGGGWTRVLADAPVPSINHGRVSDVTYYDGRFVAVGQRRATLSTGGTDVVAGVWISTDGRTWEVVDDPSLSPPPSPTAPAAPRAWISRIVAGPHGLFAFGETLVANQVTTNVVWSSSDGTRWSQAPLVLPGPPPFSMVKAALLVGGDLVIAGASGEGAAAWASRDGQSWRALPVDQATGGIIQGLATAGGRVVAVGTASDANDRPEAAVWVMSTGGDALQRAALDGDVDGVVHTDIAAGPGGFVIAGWRTSDPDPSAVAWTSEDGRTWRAVARDGTVFQRGAVANATGIAGRHFVIVGASVSVSADPRVENIPHWDGTPTLWYGEP